MKKTLTIAVFIVDVLLATTHDDAIVLLRRYTEGSGIGAEEERNYRDG